MCRVSGFVPKSGRQSGEKTVLTRKQNELLMFINKRLNDDGVSPSFDIEVGKMVPNNGLPFIDIRLGSQH